MKALKEIALGMCAAVIFTLAFILMLNLHAYAADSETWTELGDCKITCYCPCHKCCGKTANTASGAPLTRYRTIAMNGVPFGTVVYIDTFGYRVVEDRGPLGKNHIDVYTTDHQHALDLGVQYHKVWIVTKGGKS